MTPDTSQTPMTRRQLRSRSPRGSGAPTPAPTPAYSDRGASPLRARMAKKFFSAAALLFAGALAIGTSIPANAFFTGGDTAVYATANIDPQSVEVSADADGSDTAWAKYSATSATELLARTMGSRGGTYTATSGAVRWPFPYSTSITDGFGMRASPCAGCSTFHKGIDFTPGAGVPTYAIADGVVESSVVSGSGLGNEVIINHVIKGQAVQSVYGHLQMNSSPLKAGDTVKVGDLVGKVGATGTTTGANMHLEVHVAGVAVDPYGWLTNNATDDD